MSDIMKMGDEPKYLGSWDLYDSPNGKIQVTISKIQEEEVLNQGKKGKSSVCYFNEPYKPMILNVTNKKTLSKLFHSKDTKNFVGKRIEIGYEKIKAFGKISDALRISNILIPQKNEFIEYPKCEMCGNDIKPAASMSPEQVAAYTKSKYGQALCSACATKKAQEVKNNVVDE